MSRIRESGDFHDRCQRSRHYVFFLLFTKHLLLHCTVLRAVYLWSLRLHVDTKCEQAQSIAIAKMWLPELTFRLKEVIWHCKNLKNMLSKAHLLLIVTCLINLCTNKNVKTLVCNHAGSHAVTVSWQKQFLCLENLASSLWWQDPGKSMGLAIGQLEIVAVSSSPNNLFFNFSFLVCFF